MTVLLVLGLALGSVSLGFYSGIRGLTVNDESGTLVVWVVTGNAGQETPVANASVLIDPGSPSSQLLQTNANGGVQAQLQVGNHTLAVYDDQFSVSRGVVIQNKATTTANVYVTRYLVTPLLTELNDPDGTGYVNIWQAITTAVNSSSANLLLSSSTVFIDPTYVPGSATVNSTTTGVSSAGQITTNSTSASATSSQSTASSPPTGPVRAILYSNPINGSATGLWWFSWEPSVRIPLAALSDLTLSMYSASIQVQTSEP